MTSIGNGCFSSCTSWTSVKLPSTLLSIGNEAFSSRFIKQVPIKEVVIPKECQIEYDSFEKQCKVIRKWDNQEDFNELTNDVV